MKRENPSIPQGGSIPHHDKALDCRGKRFAIVTAEFYEGLAAWLEDGARRALADCGVREEDVVVYRVPGCFELPLAAKRLMHREDAGVQPLRPDHAEQSAENFTFVRLYEERDPTPLIVPGDRDVATIDDVLDEVGYFSVVAPNRGAVVFQQP